ncbi:hypothetical protein JHK82_028016 [Glycine max]|nr:hypothetical protein JHK82_028016 [Glycine max]
MAPLASIQTLFHWNEEHVLCDGFTDFASGVTFASTATGYDNATSDVLVTNSLTKAKMLGIFKEKLVKAPKELNSPASLNSCTKPKPSHEILKDFMPCNSSNAFSMCFGNDALLAYSPSNKPSIHHRYT